MESPLHNSEQKSKLLKVVFFRKHNSNIQDPPVQLKVAESVITSDFLKPQHQLPKFYMANLTPALPAVPDKECGLSHPG